MRSSLQKRERLRDMPYGHDGQWYGQGQITPGQEASPQEVQQILNKKYPSTGSGAGGCILGAALMVGVLIWVVGAACDHFRAQPVQLPTTSAVTGAASAA